jgi:DNA-binding NtrC family response regulator
MSRILLVEDESVIRVELGRFLSRHGHELTLVGTLREAVASLDAQSFELIITDLRLPDGLGTELLARVTVPVLVMTSYATVPSAVEAMRAGAADYISKPFAHSDLLVAVERSLALTQHKPPPEPPAVPNAGSSPALAGMVGSSRVMQNVFDRVRKVAATQSTVVIFGESGTGKELVARAIHELSPRRHGPFIVVNCAAIPEGLIESELFGHEKGAFTGAASAHSGLVEAAEGGTLFLDEIGELPLMTQARLLRVLQDAEVRRVGAARARKIDVRVLSATHRDLPLRIREGNFREDLYFRLRVLEIRLPPLRERKEDLPELAAFLLEAACKRENRPLPKLAPETLAGMASYAWPGNVRELANALERAAVLCDSGVITPELLAIELPMDPETSGDPAQFPSLVEYFKRFVRAHEGQLSETELARKLGISRKALWERRQRFNLPRLK